MERLLKMHPSDKQVRRWARRMGIPVAERGVVPVVVREGFVKWMKLEGLKRRRK